MYTDSAVYRLNLIITLKVYITTQIMEQISRYNETNESTIYSYIVLSLMHTLRQLSNISNGTSIPASMCQPSLDARVHMHYFVCAVDFVVPSTTVNIN